MKNISNLEQVLSLIDGLPYASVPEDIVNSVAKLPRTETLLSLKGLLFSEDENLSDRAMYCIFQMDPEFGRITVLELWKMPEWEWFFCSTAFEHGNDLYVGPLCEILSNSSDPTTRFLAAAALKPLGNAMAIGALTVALNDDGEDYEERRISSMAAEALQAIEKRISGTIAGSTS